MNVEVVTDPGTLHAGRLERARAIIINNVPAHKIPADFLEAMDFFINAQGGGLMMAGGKAQLRGGRIFRIAARPAPARFNGVAAGTSQAGRGLRHRAGSLRQHGGRSGEEEPPKWIWPTKGGAGH